MNRLACLTALAALAAPALAVNDVAGNLVTLRENGGWSWFSTNSHLVVGDQLLVGSVAGTTDASGVAGDTRVTSYRLSTGTTQTFNLAPVLERDDHNNPAFTVLPDGRLLATYQKHGADELLRRRISTNPGSITSWGPEATFDVNPANQFGNTYTNPFRLAGENGRIYNFSRSVGYDPNYSFSDDNGQTFAYGDRWLQFANPNNNNASGGRPYLKYAQAGDDAVWVAATDDHPRDFGNSIYAGFVRGGNVHSSSGTVLGPLFTPGVTPLAPSSLTRVYAGGPARRAWTTDVELDPETARPHMAFSVREIDGATTTLRYYYARLTAAGTWQVAPLAHAGSFLYAAENDYTGLVALDPDDADTLVISTDVDPVTGAAVGTGKHELYQGTTSDGGLTWAWSALTANSTVDNLRPMIPAGGGDVRAIVWMRGTYTTYANYDTDVVALLQPIPEPAAVVLLATGALALMRRR